MWAVLLNMSDCEEDFGSNIFVPIVELREEEEQQTESDNANADNVEYSLNG